MTTAYKDWGFGLCFLHLRNAKGFGWDQIGDADFVAVTDLESNHGVR
ncbi:MAG TPA: hypothetical protein VFJ87_09460 [Rhodanobacteraceae bacterium]|nr:hypothetical protein [Rhodanobacteraceae bacterium]